MFKLRKMQEHPRTSNAHIFRISSRRNNLKVSTLQKTILTSLALLSGGAASCETLFESLPWIVTNEIGINGRPACTITALTRSNSFVIEVDKFDASVQAIQTGLLRPYERVNMVVSIGHGLPFGFLGALRKDSMTIATMPSAHRDIYDLLVQLEEGAPFLEFNTNGDTITQIDFPNINDTRTAASSVRKCISSL